MRAPTIGGFRARFLSLMPSYTAVVMALVGTWILTGCGVTTRAGQSTVTYTATSPSVKTNGAAFSACPLAQAPQDATSFKPDITVNDDGELVHAVTLRQGQRIEIHLGSQTQWALQIIDPSHVLASAGSQGWHDTTSNTCVWRFTAQAPGDAQLIFSGTLPCPPLKTCPSSDRSATYRLAVR